MNKKGFTLIELLIVITIIGVLAAMIMPNLGAAQDKAKEASVKSVMHSIQLAVESYNIDEGAYPAGNKITLEDLFPTLSEDGHLKAVPKNPFTAKSYTAEDTSGQIYYSYNESDNSYIIEGYGRNIENLVLSLSNM